MYANINIKKWFGFFLLLYMASITKITLINFLRLSDLNISRLSISLGIGLLCWSEEAHFILICYWWSIHFDHLRGLNSSLFIRNNLLRPLGDRWVFPRKHYSRIGYCQIYCLCFHFWYYCQILGNLKYRSIQSQPFNKACSMKKQDFALFWFRPDAKL